MVRSRASMMPSSSGDRRVSRTRAGLVAVAGTVATGLALAVYARAVWPSVLIGWFCLVPWLVVLDRSTSLRGALVAGVLMSAGFATAVFPWFPQAVATYTGVSWPVGVVALLLLAPVLEPQFVTFALARHLARRIPGGARPWLNVLIGGGVYVGTEWAWPKLFADTLGHPLHASPLLRQAADLFGAHGLTFVLIVGNECALVLLQELFIAGRVSTSDPRSLQGQRWSARRLAAAGSCFVLLAVGLAAYGAVRLAQLQRRDAGDHVAVAMIQANIVHYDQLKAELGSFDALRKILEAQFSLSTEALRDRPDLLVWPETVYPTTFGTPKSEEGGAFDRTIGAFVNDARVPLVFGAYDAQDSDEFNAAILLEPNPDGAMVFDVYRKQRLFPFTEYLPWPLDYDRVRRWIPWAGTWKAGDGPPTLQVHLGGRPALRIAPLICYDAIEPRFAIAAVRQGAELLVTLSNDSWFSYPGVQRLILIVSAFRSIETRRPQLRSTPTGVSAVIDETGALLDTLDVDERGTLVGTVRPMRRAWTLMLAWGDWFPPTALSLSLALLLAGYRGRFV